ncbi:MAG: divalent metal cation transporter [Patescibacteria group bacterium]|nr:divalent metal cation transporter [Patescibacteria group bacterium]MDE2015525.1 divalent metal cation transporter [Patescibacteria group bacterium]MDE2226859.1 divalent metal cation transporter [Patescibacteria group bacterium]
MAKFGRRTKKLIKLIGPGLVTGAADDDPSGIATYTQTGAQFGYGQLWTVPFILPLMTAVQEACARIGAVTGKGIAAVIKEHYNKKILYGALGLILIANTINIGADLGAMGAAARLIIPLPLGILTLIFTAAILILEVFTSYKTYAKILKWLALALFSYVITVFLVHEPWLALLKATFIPHIEWNFTFLFIITGVIGTTISPYMFFWEASEEVEEEGRRHLILNGKPKITRSFIRSLRWDNFLGMLSSQAATWCIIVVAGTILNANGITNVTSAAEAAKALEPLVLTFPYAGFLAKFIFAAGIIGLGLLAVPVLSASASYALSETLNWHEGLNLKFKKAHGFYGVITIATILGLFINFVGINPIQALVVTAVVNGIISVPLIFLIARIAGSEKIMGEYKSGPLSQTLVWITFAVMAIAVVAMFISL